MVAMIAAVLAAAAEAGASSFGDGEQAAKMAALAAIVTVGLRLRNMFV